MNVVFYGFIFLILVNCAPTVKVAPPDKPIEINLNVNIEHNIKVQVDKELDDVIKKNEEIF